jgi:transglutaminase-like putative cysteine protease
MLPTGGLPDLGPAQFFLDFTVEPRQAGGLFLAEPAVVRLDRPITVASLRREDGRSAPFRVLRETLTPAPLDRRREYRYRQVTVRPADPDLGDPADVPAAYRLLLLRPAVPPLVSWTADLVRRLQARPEYGLNSEDLRQEEIPDGMTQPRGAEKLARALCAYLASSGEYTYSLDRERQDLTLDPTFDFLVNVKKGHCERYATALTLMLRTQGVPARVVKGFRGADHLGGGRYQVRGSQAHSWVEALVTRPGPGGKPEQRWLALDPTPADDAPPAPGLSLARWWQHGQRSGEALWRDFVVDYDPSTPAEALSPLGEAVTRRWNALTAGGLSGWPMVGLSLLPPLVLLGLWSGYRLWARRRPPPRRPTARVAFYARLLRLLARARSWRPAPAQTPREFAEAVRPLLRADAATAAHADVPAEVTALFYRVHYGGRPLSAAEADEVARRLDTLAAALAER